jgi:hypothetical protein
VTGDILQAPAFRYPGKIPDWTRLAARIGHAVQELSPADDFTDMLTHHYIESIDAPPRGGGAVNGNLETNSLNMHKSDGCLVKPCVAQVNRGGNRK